MRMWMVDPRILCRQHLLGEHVECHMFMGTIKKGLCISGYIEKDLLEPLSIESRHDALAEEMLKRGYKHKSPIEKINVYHMVDSQLYHKINVENSLKELLRRCSDCREIYECLQLK